jgi:hypothetical protein
LLKTGKFPVPYDVYTIGLPAVPELDMTIFVVDHVSPRLNNILSPGEKVLELIFATVCQGVEVDVPLFESFPAELT